MIPDFDAIERVGGKRLRLLMMEVCSQEVCFPLEEYEVCKYRGIGPVAVKQLQELGLVKPDPFEGLGTLARNALLNLNIRTKEEARQAVIDGRLTPGWTKDHQCIRNYGRISHARVLKWLGIPEKAIMNTPRDGGPAFPVPIIVLQGDPPLQNLHNVLKGIPLGASLRDYFIAHAPREPWAWYKPVVEVDPPEPPPNEGDPVWRFDSRQVEQARCWRQDACFDVLEGTWLHDFAKAWIKYWKDREDWNSYKRQQFDVQWPAFWADEMLKQRNQTSTQTP